MQIHRGSFVVTMRVIVKHFKRKLSDCHISQPTNKQPKCNATIDLNDGEYLQTTVMIHCPTALAFLFKGTRPTIKYMGVKILSFPPSPHPKPPICNICCVLKVPFGASHKNSKI